MIEPRDAPPHDTVYAFRMYDIRSDAFYTSKRKATTATIQDLGGEPIMDSGERVPMDAIDNDGFYPRKG